MRGTLEGVIVGLSVEGLALAAPADDLTITTYDAPEGCPDEPSFREQIARRAGGPPRASRALAISVRVKASDAEHRGTIGLEVAHGETYERTMAGPRCEDVTAALALVAALALEDARAAPEREAAAPVDTPRSEAVADAPRREAPNIEPAAEGARAVRFAFGAATSVQLGVSPDPVLAVPIFAEVAFRRPPSAGLSARFEPGVRVAGVLGASDETADGAARAAFRWTAGAVDLCPLRVGVRALGVDGCVRAEIGVLAAEGRGEPARSRERLWAALALPLRFRYTWDAVFFEAEVAGRVPLVRDTFVVRPDTTVFQPPAIGGSAQLAAGVTFP